ncbi:MAG TPA: dihydroneopterin aldolase [Spirochaetales bacterium]|jgi:FolB domain-containing protein|nr:dihydroneopterin aldolase [Spirochaetales bacterium]
MDQIFIKNLLGRGIIGINDWERNTLQEISIDVTLFADLHAAGLSDDIHDSVNYRTIAKRLLHHVETAKRYTVEALATDLARICLEDLGVDKVRIKLEKPGAVRFSSSVGVEIERFREDLT